MKFFVLAFALLLPALAAAEHPRDRWLNYAQIDADLTLAQRAYEHIHPGYARYTPRDELNQSWQAIRAQAKRHAGMRLGDFYLRLSETLALVRCDHTKAELPKALAEAREIEPVYLPFTWQMVEGQVMVKAATTESGLVRGDVILRVDGMSIHKRIAAVSQYIPVDGYTDHVKINAIAASSEQQGGGLDHFGAMLWPADATVTIDYQDRNGQQRKVTVQRVVYSVWKNISANTLARNFGDAVTFEPVNKHTAYLKIDTFVNYRQPVDPDKIFAPIFKQLKQDQTANLILDLRQNGGGSNEPPHRLLAHLINKKIRPVKDVVVKTLELGDLTEQVFTWEKSAINPPASRFIQKDDGYYSFKPNVLDDTQWIKPDSMAFTGRLIVLTSHNNASGSTNLMSLLTSRPDTVFVGEETGGSVEGPTAGVLFFLKLPASGITTRVPYFRYFNDVASFRHGKGIQPDVSVTTRVTDFIQNNDPTLQAAINISTQ